MTEESGRTTLKAFKMKLPERECDDSTSLDFRVNVVIGMCESAIHIAGKRDSLRRLDELLSTARNHAANFELAARTLTRTELPLSEGALQREALSALLANSQLSSGALPSNAEKIHAAAVITRERLPEYVRSKAGRDR